jgi:hypothetical protein
VTGYQSKWREFEEIYGISPNFNQEKIFFHTFMMQKKIPVHREHLGKSTTAIKSNCSFFRMEISSHLFKSILSPCPASHLKDE